MANTESVSHDDLAVCACGGQDYTARDAIEASLFRGELDAKWQSFLQRIAAEKHTSETDMDLDEDAIDSAAEQFRYRNDLITAEETEQWLAMRGLSLDDFSDYFMREYLRERSRRKDHARADRLFLRAQRAAPTFRDRIDFVRGFGSHDYGLSWRLAAAAAAAKDEVDSEKIEALRQNFLERSGLSADQVPKWLERIGRDLPWFDLMLRAEVEYRRRSDSLLTPQTRQREMTQLRLPLTRFETEVIELESRDAAQEALFCVSKMACRWKKWLSKAVIHTRSISFLQEDIPVDIAAEIPQRSSW